MKVIGQIDVPTGKIFIGQDDYSKIEFLCLRDHGKEQNIKADFMGLRRKITKVDDSILLPYGEKTVVTISTQYSCSMGCRFCDAPKLPKYGSIPLQSLMDQVRIALSTVPDKTIKRLNLHYARVGEPTYNEDVIESAYAILRDPLMERVKTFHPVVSTIFPYGCEKFILKWLEFKSYNNGDAGLQISVNGTDYSYRKNIMPMASPLGHVSQFFTEYYKTHKLSGRKITLNFAITDSGSVDALYLSRLFDPELFLCKITPIHASSAAKDNGLYNRNYYESYHPYEQIEEDLKEQGYDVIVFIPSVPEEEYRITCGNAILKDG